MTLPSPEITVAWSHRDDLVLYAGRVLGVHGDLAEDIVQDAYLRLHEKTAAGSSPRDARPWLFRVTRNLALDERRRIRRGDTLRTTLEVVTKPQVGPYDVVQRREEARQALRGLDALPPREKRTVILDQAGVAPSVIARVMDTTTNAVHQSLFRARRRMRETRAAAWGLVPLPVVRLLMSAANAPVVEQLPVIASGSGGRFAGGAGLAGLAVTALIGGGVVAQQVAFPGALHDSARSAGPAPGPSPEAAAPAPKKADVASPVGSSGAVVVVRSPRAVAGNSSRSAVASRRIVARTPRAKVPALAPPSPSPRPLPGADDHDEIEEDRNEPEVEERETESSGERGASEQRQRRQGRSGSRAVPDDPQAEEPRREQPAPEDPHEGSAPDEPEPEPDHSGPSISAAGNSGPSSPESSDVAAPPEPPEAPDQN